jgi:hypothetical protein
LPDNSGQQLKVPNEKAPDRGKVRRLDIAACNTGGVVCVLNGGQRTRRRLLLKLRTSLLVSRVQNKKARRMGGRASQGLQHQKREIGSGPTGAAAFLPLSDQYTQHEFLVSDRAPTLPLALIEGGRWQKLWPYRPSGSFPRSTHARDTRYRRSTHVRAIVRGGGTRLRIRSV